ncbi:hypothetical protein ElyMa_001281500, partial [Elysia marginata]
DPVGKVKKLEKFEIDAKDNLADILYKHFKKIHDLSVPLKKQLENLEDAFKADELTVQGFKFKLDEISARFSDEVKSLKPKLLELAEQSSSDDGDKQPQEHLHEKQPEQWQQQLEPQKLVENQQQPQQSQHDGVQPLDKEEAKEGWQPGGEKDVQPQERDEKLMKDQQQQQRELSEQQQELSEQQQQQQQRELSEQQQQQDQRELLEQQQMLTRKKLQIQSQLLRQNGKAAIDSPSAINDRINKHKTAASKKVHKLAAKSKIKTKHGESLRTMNNVHEQIQNNSKAVGNGNKSDRLLHNAEDSPYGVGDKGAGGRKLMASFFDRLVEMGEEQQKRARTKLRHQETEVMESAVCFISRVVDCFIFYLHYYIIIVIFTCCFNNQS